ncbi:hypothetical protein [Streptomyces sp. NPDC046942]|uniref:hypothetical protein n=1 Tax=Streptomyces sp. NPDC046942 TaxID=3155137 RepID=UPI0034102E64
MAICFQLVVNFGDDAEAAQAAARIDPKPWLLRAGAHRIPLHRLILAEAGSYFEFSILPVVVSRHCGLDGSLHRFQLTAAAELTELGHHAGLDPSADYEAFRPEYRWIRYRGEGPSNLTADQRNNPYPGQLIHAY